MKYIFITLLALFVFVNTNAQTGPGIEYHYLNGFRIKREYNPNATLQKNGVTEDGQQADTVDIISRENQGNESIEKLYARAYPNPVKDILIIENLSWQDNDIADIELSDVSGKIIIKKHLTQSKEQVTLNNLIPGTYNAKYYVNNQYIVTWKIIKL
ncbi:MAG: T9SS type A sorting domain-containing protein [Flavipsychrobacter sp.]|nr:T9SS type A sorting domain-containing protein [Flavipsychrobacter sp.]